MEQTLDQKYVVGIEVRTENTAERAQIDIPVLWQRFFEENIAAQIPCRINDELIVLYTDYEGDYTKPYTCVIGCEVSSFDSIPDECSKYTVPAANYKVFDVEGPIPETLIDQWVQIWNSNLPRSYKTDLELYPADFDPVLNPKLQLMIGVEEQ